MVTEYFLRFVTLDTDGGFYHLVLTVSQGLEKMPFL